MKHPVKVFFITIWCVAIAGGVWGWIHQAQTGGLSVAALMSKLVPAKQGLPGGLLLNNMSGQMPGQEMQEPMQELPAVEPSELQPVPVTEPAPVQSAPVAPAKPAVKTNSYACINPLLQTAQATLEQYLAERGKPTRRVDLITSYKKTPAELKNNSFQPGTCGVQYLYCDASACGYAVYYTQPRGNTGTMAASVVGSKRNTSKNSRWELSCVGVTALGKKICKQ